MHIWLLTGEYPPEYGGGIATYAHHTAQMLAQRGHDVTVFAGSETQPHGGRSEETAGRLRVVRFGLNQTPQSAALGEFARWSYDAAEVLAAYLQREGVPDVLESQEYLGLPYFTLQRRWLGEKGFDRLPVLVTVHTPLYLCYRYDGVPEYRFPGWWVGEMERFACRAANWVVFPSACLRRELEGDLPALAGLSSVVPNPYPNIEREAAQPSSQRRGFLFTAKIERRKGIEPLLKTFKKLWDEGLDEALILLGGDWYDELKQRWMSSMLQTHYSEYIERGLLQWHGKQPPAEVHQTLGQVRGMILPSLFENYPYAVLEAMASGCPVIVSASGGHAEIVEDGVSGFVFSHEKQGDLEEKITALLSMNDAAWGAISTAARRRVQQLSAYDAVAPLKEEALYRAVERSRSSRSVFPFLRHIERQPAEPGQSVSLEAGMLSIVIPFFNLGDYLEDTLRSLQGLTDLPHEIIVVDDGSTDPCSVQKLKDLQAHYFFRLIRTENRGLSLARNCGAAEARGEFLAFLDADDCMDVQFYREAIAVLKQVENISFVGCWAEYFGEAQGYWPTWNPEPPYALAHNPLNTSAMVYRKGDFLRWGLNDAAFDQIMEDYDSLLSMLENGCRGVSLPRPYFKYRVRGNSMFHLSQMAVRQKVYEQLIKKHGDLYAKYAVEVLSLLNTNGAGYLYDNPTLWYPQVGFSQAALVQSEAAPGLQMPPAPARVYFYFAFRRLFLGLYRVVERIFPEVVKVKESTKKWLIR